MTESIKNEHIMYQQDIIIPANSAESYSLDLTDNYGFYMLFVTDISNKGGATGLFSLINNGQGCTPLRINSVKNSLTGVIINVVWDKDSSIKIFQSCVENNDNSEHYTYRCKIISGM